MDTANDGERLIQVYSQLLLEPPCLVSDHFYLATSITLPNRNEAKDSGHLKYMLYFQDNRMVLVD